MKALRSIATIVATAAVVATTSLYAFHFARASDHQDSPTVVARPGADITDVFVFPAPDNAQNVVLAMDVFPLIPAGMSNTPQFALDPAVLYQFKIATNVASNDNTEKLVIQFLASGSGQTQTVTMYGPAAPNQVGTTNTIVPATGSFSFGTPAKLKNGQVQVFAGLRRDPFFFDLAQFFKIIPDRNAGFHAPGQTVPPPSATSFNGFPANTTGCLTAAANNYLANFNVIQIAVELPKSMLALNGGSPGKIGVWATASTTSGS
jgi:Domain of unknown function (DUF4331)